MYNKILIINPFGIGDVLFTTPIIHSLKEAFPKCRIGYLCNRRAKSVLENNHYLDYIFVYERDEFQAIRRASFISWIKEMNALWGKIKKERFDIAIDLSLNTQYGFLSWYAGIKERIGYDYKGRGSFLTRNMKLLGYSQKHIVEYYADLLKAVNIDLKYRNLEFYPTQQDKDRADEIMKRFGIKNPPLLISMIPGGGSSWGRDANLKHWPAKSFAELADKIIEKYGATIIILGDSSDKESVDEVMRSMNNKAIDLCGMTSVGEMAAIMDKSDVVIANDGGPLHIAVALSKKTISFFGPVDPKVYGPYPLDERRHLIFRSSLD